MPGHRLNHGDVVSSAVLIGLGTYIVLHARRWEYLGADGPGPGFFPLWYGIAMIALALGLLATSVAPRAAPADARPGGGGIGRALATWTGLAVCVALLGVLGFLLAFGLFTFFVVAVMYRRPIPAALAVAVAGPLAFYLVFPVALNVELPRGLLGF
jgi:putative tricarboxylic transport membrane protein